MQVGWQAWHDMPEEEGNEETACACKGLQCLQAAGVPGQVMWRPPVVVLALEAPV
jgi:hypothetical protein